MGKWLVALSMGVVGITYVRVVRAESAQRNRSADQPTVPADAIVVFGGKCFPHGPCIEVRDRLDHAADLWRRSVAPVVLLSGGIDEDADEVEIMRRYLVERGVPVAATGEARPGDNSRLTISCLQPGRNYVAVSSAYHAHRIAAEARRQGKSVAVDCAPDSIDLRNPRILRVQRISEVAGSILYATPAPIAGPVRRAVGRLRHTVPDLLRPSG